MRKFTLLFMSMFLVLGTAMAKDEESAAFGIQYMTPQDGAMVTEVHNVTLGFTKDVTVAFPEAGIDIVNTTTEEVVKITGIYSDEYAPKNQVTFLFEQETVPGKDGKEELRSKIIENPGVYSYTIPAGVITSVDGEEFPETTFTFSIVSTFSLADYSPKETTSLEKIELTFEKEIIEVKIPSSGLRVADFYYTQFISVKNEATISEDKKTVTLELESPITTPGQYFMDLYQGVFISADGINTGANLTFNVVDPTPSFSTNYKDGDRVKVGEFGNFEISFQNVEVVELKKTEFTVLNLTAQSSISGTAAYSEETKKITVTLEQQLTQEGTYVFRIPAGMFTMDGVENEAKAINVELYTFELIPLEVVSVTPVVGDVDSITQIVVKYNQYVKLYYDKDGVTPSQDITLTCGDEKYTLTNTGGAFLSDELIYSSVEWNGYNYVSNPITAPGTYTLNLEDIIVFHGADDIVESQWYSYAETWHAENASCKGTYSWTIKENTSVDNIPVAGGEQVIYDLLGRRVENISGAGIYIVNGKKVIVK